ncbi:MAG: translation initiation factor IF-2 [Clostridiales bacterium]|nr:translation initiation factor IF-2 [Clostridiales bacterium]
MPNKIEVYVTTKKIKQKSRELRDKIQTTKKDVQKHIDAVKKLKKIAQTEGLKQKQERKKAKILEAQKKKEDAVKKIKSKRTEDTNKGKHSKNAKVSTKPSKAKTPKRKKAVSIGDTTTVKELSEKAGISVANIIKQLMALGVMATINQELDFETAELVADAFNITLEYRATKTFEDILEDLDTEDDPKDLSKRAPIVTVMGHVDHGKTSLLDAIRNTSVTESEAGGITQHIGAYTIKVNDKFVTFLDTPGHEAFTSMRARGAQVTDIAILVVAADDGVMPQTVEAINHAKSAKVPMIVAINKMDKPGSNPDRIKQQLSEHGLLVEEWGGDIIAVPVSALQKTGIDELLEMLLLVAEIEELKANPNRLAKGTIVDAELDKGRGPVATILVQNGTLRIGDSIVAGTAYGRVRAMINDRGMRVEEAGPSIPVEVLGLSETPNAGDVMYVVQDDRLAKQVAAERIDKEIAAQRKTSAITSLDDLFDQIKEGEMRELNLIIKADVKGSAEALKQSLERLSTDEVRINTIHNGVGAINESDVMLATASNAIIIGFNVRPVAKAYDLAQDEKVDMRLYRVIYDAIQDVEAAMKGLLDPIYKEVVIGRAQVREIFRISGIGVIAGCYVTDGKIRRNASVRVVRDGIVIHEGDINSLKRFKDDAREVMEGYECGIGIENFNDIREDDVLEAFINEEIER